MTQGYTPAMVPWQHQTDARAKARDKRYFAYLMEMGTGKTKTCIDEMLELYCRDEIDVAVVFAPKGVYMNWVRNEFPLHVPESLRGEVHVVHWGSRSTEIAALRRHLEPLPGLRILVINTEAFSTAGKAAEYVRQFCHGMRAFFALDESTYIKNPSARRTKALIDLATMCARYTRIMSGMPVPRGPLDLWSQAQFLRMGLLGDSYWAFRSRYAVLKDQRFGGRKVTLVVGYRNIEELQARIAPWSFRVTKEECLDLPPKIYTTRDVEMTDEQARMYREMREYAMTDLESGEGTVSSQAVIVQMLRLQQMLCGHVKNDAGITVQVPTNRVAALMDVLSESDGKVVVWCKFRNDVEIICAAIAEEYGRGSIAQFHGGNTETRHLDSDEFQNNPDVRFMVASYAGGHGNTWTAASVVVYYSNDFDLEKRVQSEDRAHRGGQTKHVTYVDLVVRGTVDERILRALREKINIAAAITGDDWREWVQ